MKERFVIAACHTCGGHCWGCYYSDGCPQWEDWGTEPNYIVVDLTPEEIEEFGSDAIPVDEFDGEVF